MPVAVEKYPHIWFPFSHYQDVLDYPPITMLEGDGLYLYDEGGNGYIDGIGSWWTSLFGHCHPQIMQAIHEQVDTLDHVLMAGCISEPAHKLSELLIKKLPAGLNRIFYSDNGSTAIEIAMKMAIQYWHAQGETRRHFVSLADGYHGDTFGSMSLGASSRYHSLFIEKNQNFTVHSPYCYRCPCNMTPETCNAECMASLDEILTEHGATIAGCVFEPMIQGAAGMRVYPAKVVRRIFDTCKKYQVLVIADEVAVGFGRTGKLFGCNHAEITPDILCCAKGLTAGALPLAVTAATEEIFCAFKGTFSDGKYLAHGHSFTGNPIAAAAACASMRLIDILNIPDSLAPSINYFHKKLDQCKELPWIGDVRHLGLVGALELVSDKSTKAPFPQLQRAAFTVCRKALEKGLLIRPIGDVIYFIPMITITLEQIDTMISKFTESLLEIVHA